MQLSTGQTNELARAAKRSDGRWFAPRWPDDGNNPFKIVPSSTRSNNYFLILGDWGKSGGPGECQSEVARMMKTYVRDQASAGKKLLFVAVVGGTSPRPHV
jgi:hypothetical protein